MDNNIKRFGGELEFPNAEVKTSTYEARKEFFDILHYRQPQVFDELLNLFNPSFLPDGFRNDWKAIDSLTNFFLRNLEKSNLHKMEWSKVNIKPEIAKTPLIFYFDYLSKKPDELKEFAAKSKEKWGKYGYKNVEKHIKEDTLKGVIPNWKILSQDSKAKELCKSLIQWAKKYNLYEDWVLDLALVNLRNIKILIDDFQISDSDTDNQYLFSELDLNRCKSKARSESMISYIWDGLDLDPFESYLDTKDYPVFDFNAVGFKVSDTWMPGYTTKQVFSERVEKELFIQTKKKLLLIYESNNNFESVIKDLQEIKSASEKFKKRLKEYCSKVLKIQPTGMVKTPLKKTGIKHFEWLIDFQINNPIEKSYEDIAKENNTDSKAVRSGIESVSKIISLKLRIAPKTGRPKGVKETKERGNYSRW